MFCVSNKLERAVWLVWKCNSPEVTPSELTITKEALAPPLTVTRRTRSPREVARICSPNSASARALCKSVARSDTLVLSEVDSAVIVT